MSGPPAALQPTAFPPSPPTDPGDPAAVLAADRTAFDQLTHMKNHWDRPGWVDGTRKVYWLLTFEDHPELIATTLALQEHLRPLGLDLISPAYLHLTLVRVGPHAELSSQQLDRLASAATGRLGRAFTFAAYPLAGSTGAVRYSVAPWTEIAALHASLTRLNEELELPGGKPTSTFRPHLGLAYSAARRDAGPVVATVTALRSTPPVTLTVKYVDLVELRREPSRYTWNTLHRVALPMHKASSD